MNSIRFYGKRYLLKGISLLSLKATIKQIFDDHDIVSHELSYIIVNDQELLKINNDYLQHNYYTDIITFDLSEEVNHTIGEIYISQDRVIENADLMNSQHEFIRVCLHGALHLSGFHDKTPQQIKTMRQKEDQYINLYLQKKETVSRGNKS